jgi:ubiquitin carboxyl-terminal hydrolase 4/11/15
VWKVPRILVVHLKRFSYRNKYWREKLDTFVDFPLDDLDLSPHVLGPGTRVHMAHSCRPHQNNHLVVSCLALTSLLRVASVLCCCAVSTPPVYELYAVSNHYGSLGGGHYTAYAKNHRENKWYKFDDSSVSSVQAESVKTSAAYVLFYRLKEDASEWRGMPTDPSTTAAPLVIFATFWFTAVCFCAVFLSPRTGALTHVRVAFFLSPGVIARATRLVRCRGRER